ncbi:diguanylate cyclase [Pleionea mediterranea]|uniref:diguanylate cyclase n=2 Tax=Pleionea mediterranea TaxID=523701 RepID=A0A316G067_9GAMM|nr:diguanylate cyclase [Pleionea mediterranea]
MKFLLCFSILLTSLYVFSETEKSSFWKQLEKTEKLRTSDLKKFSHDLKQIERMSEKLSKEEQIYLSFLRGMEDLLLGNSKASIQKVKLVKQSASTSDLKTKSSILLLNTYAITRDWTEGLSEIEFLNKHLETSSQSNVSSRAYLAIAIFYNQLGEYDLGQINAKKALLFNANERTICAANSIIIESRFNLTGSLKRAENVLQNCSKANEPVYSSFLITFVARNNINKGNLDGAEKLLKKHLASTENTQYNYLISEHYQLLAQIYLQKNDLVSAKSFAEKIISMSEDNIPYKPFVAAYKTLYEVSIINNNYKKAIQYFEKYHSYDKKNLNQAKLKSMAVQTIKHKVNEKNNEIEILNKENESLTLQRSLSKKEATNKSLVILLLTLVISFIFIWLYRTKQTHIKLKQLAEFDSLTGISNRRHFTKESESALLHNQSTGQVVSFILFDLDKFKFINDTHGHPIGDQVLQSLKTPVLKHTRKVDLFGRIGGEEFAILLPGCELEKASEIADKIRTEISELDIKVNDKAITITASFGITVSRISGYNFDTLMKHSDEALYDAKHAGRNRCMIYSSSNDEHQTS